MKINFFIRRFVSKKSPEFTYLALICKIDGKSIFITFDTAVIYQLCDCSVLHLLQPGEEIQIDG